MPNRCLDQLARKYERVTRVNPELSRSLVSFQANRKLPFYRWFRYKEGFSEPMMRYLITHSGLNGRSKLLDPFSGSGAALFSALSMGLSPVGIELLPVGAYVTGNRSRAAGVPVNDIDKAISDCSATDFAGNVSAADRFNHLAITEGAFPKDTERQLLGYLNHCRDSFRNADSLALLNFAAFCILESISYTRKDGQYLRWDHRARGNVNGHRRFDKGKIPRLREAIIDKLTQIRDDLSLCSPREPSGSPGVSLLEGSALEIMPTITADSLNIVVTSPPYCNRYDYTRTYALELAFLGVDEEGLKRLRQEMLTCTVENREKTDKLRAIYSSRRAGVDYETIAATFDNHAALHEVLGQLDTLRSAGMLNNPHVVRMVRNYFFEMCFVVHELYRVLTDRGVVYMVNDNVRYGGVEVPVDLILSDFAALAGFTVKNIWTLDVGKGNSSQQMGAHGRAELRKCVYVWQK